MLFGHVTSESREGPLPADHHSRDHAEKNEIVIEE